MRLEKVIVGTGDGSLFLFTPLKALYYKAFYPLQECPLNARRVPLNASQFSKKGNYDPHFLPIFTFLKS